MKPNLDFIASARRVLTLEQEEIGRLLQRIDANFTQACKLILSCQGRVIVTGMGKSGHIAKKIAATLASTGTPSFFVHPAEASHGDMGMFTKSDVVIAISNSGTVAEILTILPLIARLGAPLISFTGDNSSPLAQQAQVNLDIGVEKEACPLNLAPTSSTTVTLALGDALAVALLEARGFTQEDFAFSHPGGALGRRLLLMVDDIMHIGDQIPKVQADTSISDALVEMTQKKLGMTCIVDDQDKLLGIYTDGDVRRTLTQGIDVHETIISSVMSTQCKTLQANTLAAEALKLMEDHKITMLVIVDQDHRPVGALNMQDLLRAGVV